ncbi:MAG TPA: hypothetical protein DEP72_07870 [Clostridiales bacterium]|nr:hypothetical protein [Clostridiales bacterium]
MEDVNFIENRIGRCYILAYEFVKENDDWTLINGEIIGNDNEMMQHAWAEKGKEVYEPILDMLFEKNEYYSRHQANPINQYTQDEARRYMLYYGKHCFWEKIPETKFEYDYSAISDEIVGWIMQGNREALRYMIENRIVNPEVILEKWKQHIGNGNQIEIDT